jgi:arylsulfatase
VLEAASLPQPAIVHGVHQKPIEGVSMAYSFDDAVAAERHQTQYFEMFCNRGIYHKGWTAVTKHRTPWAALAEKLPAFDQDCWELYDTTTDWSQAKDLAKQQPDKLHELQRLWLIEAAKYNVLPLDDRTVARLNPDTAGRPQLVKGDRQLLFGGMGRLTESSILNLHNKSHAITADVVLPKEGAEGVIVALGGIIGGWSLYAKNGRLKYCYNFYGLKYSYTESTTTLPKGRHQLRMEFEYDGGGVAKGGNVTLYVDGKSVATGRVDETEPAIFSADETCDIGTEYGSSVTTDYNQRQFTGEVNWVEFVIGEDAKQADADVSVADRLHLAMGIQ